MMKPWRQPVPEGEPNEVDGSAWDKLPPAPQAVFLDWRDLPEPVRKHLDAMEQFIGDVDGKETVISTGDDSFIDDGIIDASDAVIAINGLITTIARLRDLLKQAKNHVAESERADAHPLWGEIHEALPHQTQEQRVENAKLHGFPEGPKYAPAHKVR